jgi:hypothetical protein
LIPPKMTIPAKAMMVARSGPVRSAALRATRSA